ncbi:MAG: LVIVD repeat-containing protein [Candidatus Heimdallarchaeota archaeon]
MVGFLFNSYSGFSTVTAYLEPNNGIADYSIKKIGQYDTGFGNMFDLFISGNYVYTACRRGGMATFDISSLSSPSLVSIYDDPTKEVSQDQLWGEHGGCGLTDGVFVEDDIAYLADGSNGLVILNVSSPEQPVKVGHYFDGGGFSNVFVKNGFAFLRGSDSIRIIDISNIFEPRLAKKISVCPPHYGCMRDFAVRDNYLYISSSFGLFIYNITDPYNPVELSLLEDFSGFKITVFKDRLFAIEYEWFLTGNKYNLSVFDIDDPLSPLFLGECFFYEVYDDYILNFVVSDSFAYIATYNNIFAINTTDHTSPELAGSIQVASLGHSTKTIALQSSNDTSNCDGVVFCADSNKGLLIYNFSSPTNPFFVSQHTTGYQAESFYTSEDFVYICSQEDPLSRPSALEIISLEEPSNPTLIGSYHCSGTITDVVVHQDFAFLSLKSEPNHHSLEIVDVSDPAEPQMVGYYNGSVDLDSQQIEYDAARKIVYLADDYEDGFSILNVTNYSQPTLLASYRTMDGHIVDLDLQGDVLFIAGGDYNGGSFFRILDVSDPSSPTTIYSTRLGAYATAIEFDSNMLYITTITHPLVIYDATDIFAPKKISTFFNDLFNIPGKVQIKDNFAYIARDMNGLIVLDISHPKRMKSLIEYRPEYSGISKDVTFYKKYILLADGWDGIEILELVPPAISKPIILTMIILPSLVGFSIVVLIVIRTSLNIKKQKTN